MLSIFKPEYIFTITSERDDDFRKYLARRLRVAVAVVEHTHSPDAIPLDISLDDDEGDVVAGISAVTYRGSLHIDMLWVDAPLRGKGIGRKLVQMAEEIALKRGCTLARTCAYVVKEDADGLDFCRKLGYTVAGKLQQFPHGDTLFWLQKDLIAQAVASGMYADVYEWKGPA